MSREIDDRIVQMQFNNRQFESGVKESLGTLEKLKSSLKLDGAAKGLENVGDAAKRFSLAGIASGVDDIASRFNAMSVVGITALANLTNGAVEAGKRIVSALTIDPVKSGFAEYELKMGSVQTIMAGSGENLETVNKYLEELNRYSDRTIYSFQDMTSNIGKFTNAGVSLKDSVAAIQGISNVAARSGANADEASRAMYNFSQTISSGHVDYINWRSIELANMATKEFKTYLLDTAVAAGTLKKNSQGMYVTLKGNELNATKNFNDTLTDQWMTAEVLTKTLQMYSDESTDIGKKAFAAAQDVKTLSQMFDTLKEAAQSGWAQTWELLFGDFEEGKNLFTKVNEVVGGFIGGMADARNETLKFWKANGGRDVMIEALGTAFKNLNTFIMPVTRAFKNVFSPVTGKMLVDFSKKLLELVKTFKLSNEAGLNVTRIFSGIFSVVSMVGKAFAAVVRNVLGFVKYLTPASKGILEFAGDIGTFLFMLNETNDVGKEVDKAFAKMKEVFSKAAESVKASFEKIKGVFGGFDKIDLSGVESFMGTVKAQFKPVEAIKKGIEKIIELGASIIEKAKPVFSKVKEVLSDAVSGIDLTSLLQLFNSGIFAGVLLGVVKLVKSFQDVADKGTSFLDKITGILDGVKDSLKAWQNDLKAGTLLKVAGAVAILAGSLFLISMIDPNRMKGAITAITVLFGELLGSMAIFDKIAGSSGFRNMAKVTKAMLGLSISLLILAKAVKILGGLDWNGLAKGISGLGGIVAILVAASKILSNSAVQMVKGSVGLILFGAAIRVLVYSVEALGQMNSDALIQGLLGVLGIAATLATFLKTVKIDANALKIGAGLILLGIAIRIMVESVAALGALDPVVLQNGLVTLGAIVGGLAVFTRLVGNGQNFISLGIGMVFLGASMLIFTKAVEMLGNMPYAVLEQGLTAMGLALGALVVALTLMPPNVIAIGFGLTILSVGLLLIAQAIGMMGALTWDEIIRGLTAMGGALTILVIAMNAMTGGIVGAIALGIMTASLLGLAVVLRMLGAMSLPALGIALLAIAGTLGVLGLAALALTPVIPSMFALGAALLLLGIGIAAIGAASIVLGMGLAALSTVSIDAVGVLLAFAAAMVPVVVLAPAMLVVGAALVVLAGGIFILGLSFSVLGAGLNMLAMVGPKGMMMLNMLLATTAMIAKFAIEIAVAGAGLILFGTGAILVGVGALIAGAGIKVFASGMEQLSKVDISNMKGFAELSGDLLKASAGLLLAAPGLIAGGKGLKEFGAGASATAAGVMLIQTSITSFLALLKTVPEEVKDNGSAIINTVRMLMEHITETMAAQKVKLLNTVRDLCTASANTIDSYRFLFVNSGINLVDGFVEGINSRIEAAAQAAAAMAARALAAANKQLAINSPSKAFEETGKFADLGFAKGLTKYAYVAVNAAKSMAQKTLTPVIDMSKATGGLSIGFSGTPTIAPIIARDFQNGRDSGSDSSVNGSSPTNVSFVQNNYSPKALSRLDIYRQTKNQISTLKGALNGT